MVSKRMDVISLSFHKNINYDIFNPDEYEEILVQSNIVGLNKVKTFFYLFFKRAADIIFSSLALILLLLPLVIVGLIIKLEDGGPVFYVQERMGQKKKKFKMYKLRSMCVDADKQKASLMELNERDGPAFKIKDDPRITRIGKVIRKTCIDELPQLINIIKGDMSIVGPRPALPNEVQQYDAHYMKRLSVKPGLTCYWQVRRTSSTSFDEWVGMDLKYIKERSLWVDLKLIFMTIVSIFSGKCLEG